MYTIKQLPEDFIVTETSHPTLSESGSYFYCTLKKKNRNTLDVIKQLAKFLKIKEKDIGFAGSKDKHAITTQIISIKGISKDRLHSIKIDYVELEFLGFSNEPISLGDLEGNEFEIIVRNLDDVQANKIHFIENYFDEQRFGSNNAEVGKALIKKDFRKAVELLELKCEGNDYIGALKRIPMRLLRMYVNAYQSYLWNETLAEYLKGKGNLAKEVSYSQGKFVFVENQEDLEIPLIGFGVNFDEGVAFIIERLMRRESINVDDFIIKQIPELSLEGENRKAFIEVHDFRIGELEEDDLNSGKNKIKISFSLPKGSYATMVVKRLFE
jgi:tRNA pseudouridine13 synthase